MDCAPLPGYSPGPAPRTETRVVAENTPNVRAAPPGSAIGPTNGQCEYTLAPVIAPNRGGGLHMTAKSSKAPSAFNHALRSILRRILPLGDLGIDSTKTTSTGHLYTGSRERCGEQSHAKQVISGHSTYLVLGEPWSQLGQHGLDACRSIQAPVRSQRRARARHHERLGNLAVALVRHAHHARVCDARIFEELGLELGGRDLEALDL